MMRYFVFTGNLCQKGEILFLSEIFGSTKLISDYFIEEQEIFVNSPFSFAKLEKTFSAIYSLMKRQDIVFLVDIEMKKGILYKGPPIDVLKKTFVPKFEYLLGKPLLLNEIEDARKIFFYFRDGNRMAIVN